MNVLPVNGFLLFMPSNFEDELSIQYRSVHITEIGSLSVFVEFKLCSKQYNKIDLLHLIVVAQLSGGW